MDMNTSKKVYLESESKGTSLNSCVLWNLLVTLVQIDMPTSKRDFADIFERMRPLLEELAQAKLPDSEGIIRELKYKHLLKVSKRRASLITSDHYEELDSQSEKLKWDMKLVKNTLNYDGMSVRKNEQAICLFCGSDCRSGHNFCEHLRGKQHAQKVVDVWKLIISGRRQETSKCVVCNKMIGCEEWEFEAHQRSNAHRCELLKFIGMPYCEPCGMYLKYGMKVHQTLPVHREMERMMQVNKKRTENSFKQIAEGGTLLYSFDHSIKVSDPCKGGASIRANVGISSELFIEILNTGDSSVEVDDCILDSKMTHLFGMNAQGAKLPISLQKNESMLISIKMLSSEPGFIRSKFIVKISDGREITRELRYLCLPCIILEDLEQEMTKMPTIQSAISDSSENACCIDENDNALDPADQELLSRLGFSLDL